MAFTPHPPIACLAVLLLALLSACGEDASGRRSPKDETSPAVQVQVPVFQEDSAYVYVERQLAFGPRVPGTPAHTACGSWLAAQLRAAGAQVTEQTGSVRTFNGITLTARNLIAAFSPGNARRVMLSAHWDTRPFADQDDERKAAPIPGANDGASGVAVLLEIARHLQAQSPAVGVDIIFWDVEDYGESSVEDSYCLGSQLWTRQRHQPGYTALYGINLDMVGAEGAVFPREGYSMLYAPQVVEKVWRAAQRIGYGAYFSSERANPIIDDHYYISSRTGIGTIDIIHMPPGGGFFPYWHTHDDDLPAISRQTLKAVGQTVLEVVYKEP
jgi:Zn-dependent M28 family amino/carboxypeptidase